MLLSIQHTAILPDWVSGQQEDAHEFLLGVFKEIDAKTLPEGRLALGNIIEMVLKAAEVNTLL